MDIKLIATKILSLANVKKVIFVGIDGRSGSGKTSVAIELSKLVSNSEVIHLDNYDMYRGEKSYKEVIDTVILPALNLNKNQIIILEGVFALNKKLRDYYDYSIWVECSKEIGFKRGLKRDINLNGIDNSDKWLNYWLPKEDSYILEESPKEFADVTIINN